MCNVSTYVLVHIWDLATKVDGYDPSIWRKDFAGAWIRRDQYNQQGKYGWVVDHLIPTSVGGNSSMDNLRALHWQNNQRKGNDYPVFFTSVTADGNRNIEKEKKWQIQ